jgi:hypothetical protein
MREQEASSDRGLGVLAAHRQNRTSSAGWIIVDPADFVFLPVEQLELLANEPGLRNETDFFNERDDISRSDLVGARLLAPTHVL